MISTMAFTKREIHFPDGTYAKAEMWLHINRANPHYVVLEHVNGAAKFPMSASHYAACLHSGDLIEHAVAPIRTEIEA